MKKWGALFLLLLSACTVGPVYEPPEMDLPCEWQSELSYCSSFCEEINWWERLQDPKLNELMNYAYEQNLDLKIASLRVLQARAEANAKKGDLYPRLDGSLNYGHVYYSKDALVNGLLGTALPVESNNVRRNVNFYEIGFDAEWELDFFGRTAHEIAALKAHEEAVQENLWGIWVTLSAEIAKNYIELRSFQKRMEYAKRTLQIQEDKIALTKELFDRGIINDSDYAQVQADLSLLNNDIPLLEFNALKSIHRLSILLGYPPEDLFDCLNNPSLLPHTPLTIDLCLPSELLQRRSDIKKAERELAAATERVGSAIASLFPRFSLRGFIGDISTHAGSIFSPASATWFAGPQILVPIFNSRLILQEVEYNKLLTQEALYTYQKTVLEALEESENAIASFKMDQERHKNSQFARDLLKKALVFSEDLYTNGVNDKFQVGSVENAYLASELKALQSHVDLLLSYIALYKAMGGSWDCSN